MDRLRLLELKPSPAGFFRGWYERDIAALFTEADPYFEAGEDDERTSCGYQTTARQMRERRQARGFSAQRAWSGLASAVAKWAEEPGDGRPPGSVEDEFQRYARQLEDFPLDRIEEHSAAYDQPSAFLVHLDTRDVLRLLLDRVPDDTVVALDLSELTGCCVEMDPQQPIAELARQEQLQHVALDSPLIVLAEGSTDSRLLSDGMKITHPHLSGFINFIDFDSFKAEGGVAMLPKIVYAFVASGVANAAGQAHSSRSRICCTWLPASVISCSRRAPRRRSRPHVSSTGSGT